MVLEDVSGKTGEGRQGSEGPNQDDNRGTRSGDWGGGQGEGVFNPHPLQGKVLLVTFGGQAVTHKLQLQGHMGEHDQEFLKGREDESGSHPVFTSTTRRPPFRPGETYPKHHDKVKLLPGLHHMDFQ